MTGTEEIQAAIEKLTYGQKYGTGLANSRTIDAQLAILHEAAYQISTGDGFIQKELNLFLRLARAINGVTP